MRAGFTTGAAGVLERSNLTVRTRRQAVGPYNGFSRASRDSESWRRLWNWERGRRDLAAVEGSGQRMDIRGGDCEADNAGDAERERGETRMKIGEIYRQLDTRKGQGGSRKRKLGTYKSGES